MKTRIEEERRRQRLDLDAHLKEGPGGIRDVEFLVQALQLFYGGAHPELRTGNVLDALGALRSLGILPDETASALSADYLWLRRAEHALQLEEERQVHTMPRGPAAQRAQARRMGYRDAEAERARQRMLDDWTAARTQVRGHFEALVLGETP
jgi:glutamate-ammonia-ligase adenylyltransferase